MRYRLHRAGIHPFVRLPHADAVSYHPSTVSKRPSKRDSSVRGGVTGSVSMFLAHRKQPSYST